MHRALCIEKKKISGKRDKKLACRYLCRGEKTRTSDLHVPNVARCQLCYTPALNAGAKVVIFLITHDI